MAMHNLACPDCDASGLTVPIQTEGGRTFCGNGHKFEDSEALLARSPRAIPGMKTPTPPKAPTNTLQISFKVNPKFKEALEQRFGGPERLEASIPAILSSVMDPAALFISGEDSEMMSRALGGEKLRDGKSIVGKLFALTEENKQLAKERDALKAKNGADVPVDKDGGISVPFDPIRRAQLQIKANGRNQTVQQVIEDTMVYALDEGWL